MSSRLRIVGGRGSAVEVKNCVLGKLKRGRGAQVPMEKLVCVLVWMEKAPEKPKVGRYRTERTLQIGYREGRMTFDFVHACGSTALAKSGPVYYYRICNLSIRGKSVKPLTAKLKPLPRSLPADHFSAAALP